MERKTTTIDLMLAATIIGIVYQKIDTPEFMILWILIGLFLGLFESNQLLGRVFPEIAIGTILLAFLAVIFELVLHIQIFASFPESDPYISFMMGLYQPLLIGFFISFGAAFPIVIRLDKAGKQDSSKEESPMTIT